MHKCIKIKFMLKHFIYGFPYYILYICIVFRIFDAMLSIHAIPMLSYPCYSYAIRSRHLTHISIYATTIVICDNSQHGSEHGGHRFPLECFTCFDATANVSGTPPPHHYIYRYLNNIFFILTLTV